jgi:hypothetical protein
LVLSGCRARSRAQRTSTHQPAASAHASDAAPRVSAARPAVSRTDAGARPVHPGTPVEIGAAARLAGVTDGVLIRTTADDLVRVALDHAKPGEQLNDEQATSAIPAPTTTRGSRAYWISHGRLVRRAFSPSATGIANAGPLEVIAKDAYDATRAAARTVDARRPRDLVAYIASPGNPQADRRARVWVEDGDPPDASRDVGRAFDLSDEGAGASSVALAGTSTHLWAVSLDARIAMSPVHARTIDFGDGRAMHFGTDVVVFVGEAEPAHTEIDLAVSAGEPLALLPLPRDAGGFGIAAIAFGREPRLDSPAVWTMFPNGLKPALIAVGRLCGAEWVAYPRPTEPAPKAPHTLVMAPIDGLALGEEVAVATAMRFTSLAFAPASPEAPAKHGAGWLAWSADGRSFACTLRCP